MDLEQKPPKGVRAAALSPSSPRWVTLAGLTLGCGGKRLVSSIKTRGNWICIQLTGAQAELACVRNTTHAWQGGGGGDSGGSFLWQYWEPGVRSEEIEVKTLEGGATGAGGWGGGLPGLLHSCGLIL